MRVQTYNRDASHCPRTPVDLRAMHDVATYFRGRVGGEKGERERKKKALLRFSPLFTPSELSTLALCLQDSSSVPLRPAYFSYRAVSLPTVARSGFLALSLSLEPRASFPTPVFLG